MAKFSRQQTATGLVEERDYSKTPKFLEVLRGFGENACSFIFGLKTSRVQNTADDGARRAPVTTTLSVSSKESAKQFTLK